MNDESITSSSPSSPGLFPGRFSRFLKRVGDLLRREPGGDEETEATPRREPGAPAPSEALLLKARAEVSAYTEENSDLLERATRFQRRYDRLRREGNPSESVGNRAERARSDFREGLLAARERFAFSHGDEGGRAFDLEAAGLLAD